MIRSLLLLFALHSFQSCFSQEDLFKLDIGKPFSLFNQSIEIGYEHRFPSMLSTEIRVGYALPESIWDVDNHIKERAQGWKASVAGRYYFREIHPLLYFTGIEADFHQREQNMVFRFNPADYSDSLYFSSGYSDTTRVHRQMTSISAIIGIQRYFGDFFLEFSAGIGFRHRKVWHTDRTAPDDPYEILRHPSIFVNYGREGNFNTLCVPLGLRIGYSF